MDNVSSCFLYWMPQKGMEMGRYLGSCGRCDWFPAEIRWQSFLRLPAAQSYRGHCFHQGLPQGPDMPLTFQPPACIETSSTRWQLCRGVCTTIRWQDMFLFTKQADVSRLWRPTAWGGSPALFVELAVQPEVVFPTVTAQCASCFGEN